MPTQKSGDRHQKHAQAVAGRAGDQTWSAPACGEPAQSDTERDGEALRAEDADAVGLPRDVAVEAQVGHPAGEERQRLLQLGAGERGAEAVVDAGAERQLRLIAAERG